MYLVLCVINLPIFVTFSLYDHPLWSVLLASIITPCVQDPLSSHYTTTVDPIGNNVSLCDYHYHLGVYLAMLIVLIGLIVPIISVNVDGLPINLR